MNKALTFVAMKATLVIGLLFLVSVSFFSQNRKEKIDPYFFGMQFKPIVPVNYFGITDVNFSDTIANINLDSKFGYSLGMVFRRNFTPTISLETGINYVRRNYQISSFESKRDTSDNADFGFISYEIPVQGLVYIRLAEKLYMNTSAGFGFNFFASDVVSVGENTLIEQLTTRIRWMDFSLLANLGFEYRTEEDGNFYIGASLVNPFRDLMITRINYFYGNTDYEQYTTPLRGNYLTLDLRYFLPVHQEEKKVLK